MYQLRRRSVENHKSWKVEKKAEQIDTLLNVVFQNNLENGTKVIEKHEGRNEKNSKDKVA